MTITEDTSFDALDWYEYEVTIIINVTAGNPQDAAHYALGDLRDPHLIGPWLMTVRNMDTEEVTEEQAD